MASRRLKVGHSGTITCAAISPDASFVVSTGSEAIAGEPSNGTGTLKRLWCLQQHGKGEWLGKTMIKKWSNQWWFRKKDGCFWIRNNAAMFLGWLFFIRVDLSRNHGTPRIFLGASETNGTPHIWSPTKPAREPSSFGQCHKSWLRSATSLSEWTVGECFFLQTGHFYLQTASLRVGMGKWGTIPTFLDQIQVLFCKFRFLEMFSPLLMSQKKRAWFKNLAVKRYDKQLSKKTTDTRTPK